MKLLLGLGMTLALVGCGPDPGPDKPSFEKDVKPIMFAHCVRCHGAGGTLNADPNSHGLTYMNRKPNTTHLTQFEAPAACKPMGCLGAKDSVKSFASYIPGTDMDRMPPAPAAPLSDRDAALVLRWANTDPPAP